MHLQQYLHVLGKLLNNPFYATYACSVCVSSNPWISTTCTSRIGKSEYVCTMELQRSLISHGVPQGSISGLYVPLFCPYIAALPSCNRNSKNVLHADDTSIQYSSPSIAELQVNIQENMNAICMWQWRNSQTAWAAEISVMLYSLSGTRKRVTGQKIDVAVNNETCIQGII